MQSSPAFHITCLLRLPSKVILFYSVFRVNGDCDKRSLGDCDVGKAFHCFIESCLLLIVNHLDASGKHFRVPLDLFYNIQQSTSNLVIPLNMIHSHVIDVLISWRNDLNDVVEESISDKRNDTRQVAVVVA